MLVLRTGDRLKLPKLGLQQGSSFPLRITGKSLLASELEASKEQQQVKNQKPKAQSTPAETTPPKLEPPSPPPIPFPL
jgi:hypothetical protein